jgi:hypothetical protein
MAVAGAALAPTVAAAPPKDLVTGGGITSVGTHMGFVAHSDANGANPGGHVTLKNHPLETERKGVVVCLRVEGNRAVIGIELRNSNQYPSSDPFRTFVVEDNGNPSTGVPDQIREISTGAVRPDCSDPAEVIPPTFQLRNGNIVVRNA